MHPDFGSPNVVIEESTKENWNAFINDVFASRTTNKNKPKCPIFELPPKEERLPIQYYTIFDDGFENHPKLRDSDNGKYIEVNLYLSKKCEYLKWVW